MTEHRPASTFLKAGITVMFTTLFLSASWIPIQFDRTIYYNCSHNDEEYDFLKSSEMLALKMGIGSTDRNLTAHPKYLRHIRSLMTSPPYPADFPGSRPVPRLIHNRTDWSQLNQSSIVDRLLRGRRNGFFVECGANNGEWLSNSLFFELHRNWTGLLIEASPINYRELLLKNRNVYTFGGCLSVSGLPQMLPFQTNLFFWGFAAIAPHPNVSTTEIPGASAVIQVFCVPLNDLLAAIGRTHVDYLSLDIEGPEPEVLEHVNWNKLRIDVLTVEHGYSKSLDRLRKIVLGTGLYVEVQVLSWDVVFARKEVMLTSR